MLAAPLRLSYFFPLMKENVSFSLSCTLPSTVFVCLFSFIGCIYGSMSSFMHSFFFDAAAAGHHMGVVVSAGWDGMGVALFKPPHPSLLCADATSPRGSIPCPCILAPHRLCPRRLCPRVEGLCVCVCVLGGGQTVFETIPSFLTVEMGRPFTSGLSSSFEWERCPALQHDRVSHNMLGSDLPCT